MKKMLAVLAGLLLITTFAVANEEPNIDDIVAQGADPALFMDWPIIYELDPNLPVTDVGPPYALAWVFCDDYSYCNRDRVIWFANIVEVAQWLRVDADNLYRLILVRKPGTYEFKAITVRMASNGDVRVTFIPVCGGWDAPWWKPNSGGATPLDPQVPVDKTYMVETVSGGKVVGATKWEESPAEGTNNTLVFKNSEKMHNLARPTEGFNLRIRERVVPCNTVGIYSNYGLMDFNLVNQKWFIDRRHGGFHWLLY